MTGPVVGQSRVTTKLRTVGSTPLEGEKELNMLFMRATRDAHWRFAHMLMREIIGTLAPRKTHALRRSGFIDIPGKQQLGRFAVPHAKMPDFGSKAPKSFKLVMGFGGGEVPYAMRQHQEYPQKRTPGTIWKYLTDPFQKRSVELTRKGGFVDREIRKALWHFKRKGVRTWSRLEQVLPRAGQMMGPEGNI